MGWSVMNFGKHNGKTLPEIIFSDPDWFFWAIGSGVFNNKGELLDEANDMYAKSRNIKIIQPEDVEEGKILVAEYGIHPPTCKFAYLRFVDSTQAEHEGSTQTIRRTVIDMSMPTQISKYDKLGCKKMISDIKWNVFNDRKIRLTKTRCEEFFDNNSNFVLP